MQVPDGAVEEARASFRGRIDVADAVDEALDGGITDGRFQDAEREECNPHANPEKSEACFRLPHDVRHEDRPRGFFKRLRAEPMLVWES
jgi:hypothetical protein